VLKLKVISIMNFSILSSISSILKTSLNDSSTKSRSINDMCSKNGLSLITAKLERLPKLFYQEYMEMLYPSSSLGTVITDDILKLLESEIPVRFISEFRRIKYGLGQILFYSWRVSTLRMGMPDLFDLILLPLKPGLYIHISILIKSLIILIHKASVFYYSKTYFFIREKYYGDEIFFGRYVRAWYLFEMYEMDSMIHSYTFEEMRNKQIAKFLSGLGRSKSSTSLKEYLRLKQRTDSKSWDALKNLGR
jgi:hypothetical protein